MRTVDWPLMPGDGRAVGDDGPDVGRAADSRHAGQRERDRNPGRGASRQPSSSADGRFVAFSSTATTLVAGDTNGSAGAVTRLGDVCPLAAAPFSVIADRRHDRERRSAHRGRALDLLVRGRAVLGRRRVGAAHPAAVVARRDTASAPQCRKWRLPVNTIARPCSSAAVMTSASFTEPPGWTTAVAPAAARASRPSRNGK